MTIDLVMLRNQVQNNCDISDANHSGLFSLCGLLLRLRDLYKSEQNLRPWEEPEPAALLEWIDAREKRWEGLIGMDFQSISLGGESFDPFDVAAINERLRPSGLVYGAGFAVGMKPSFFLGELVHSQTLERLTIDTIDRELVRDLFVTPALRQGSRIFARRSAMLFFLWDQVAEMRPSARQALAYAFGQHDIEVEEIRRLPMQLATELQSVADSELDTWIYHEIGEVKESGFPGQIWHEIVSTYSNGPIEIFARVLKDLLADTHTGGLLGHIIQHRLSSSLGFFVSFIRPFTRLLFPEVIEAFDQFMLAGDWSTIEKAREAGHTKAHDYAEILVGLHEAGRKHGPQWAESRIMSTIMEPLGIIRDSDEEPR